MIFDKFCAAIERHFPHLLNEVNAANLFIYDKPPHAGLPTKNTGYDDLIDLFTLPFPVTVVEDPCSMIMLLDTKENQIGFGTTRHFTEVLSPYTKRDGFISTKRGFGTDEEYYQQLRNAGIDDSSIIIVNGCIDKLVWKDDKYSVAGWINRVVYANKRQILMDSENPRFSDLIKNHENSLKNAISALEEIMQLYTKSRFVLEQAPVQEKQKKANKKILRSHQRPIYTILDARTIREKLDIESPTEAGEGGRKSPIPHERRRHPRKLTTASGYKEDKIIIIPATWIGQSEKIIGGKRYKVRLDI